MRTRTNRRQAAHRDVRNPPRRPVRGQDAPATTRHDPRSAHGYVLVGLGDGDEGQRALKWAALEAQERGAELRILRAYNATPPLAPWEWTPERGVSDAVRAAAHAYVRDTVAKVERAMPGLAVGGDAIHGNAAEMLVEHAKAAALTVVGSRNLGVLGAAALGSVSTLVAAGAPGPVVVVDGSPALPADDRAVVVGVDGSPASDDVLDFAFGYANRHGRPLRAVHCWPLDAIADARWHPSQPPPEQAERWLADSTAAWQEKYPDVAVHHSIVRSRPVPGLVSASFAQELLVVGSDSRRPRAAALLGSVTQAVLHHATCPVAVIRGASDR